MEISFEEMTESSTRRREKTHCKSSGESRGEGDAFVGSDVPLVMGTNIRSSSAEALDAFCLPLLRRIDGGRKTVEGLACCLCASMRSWSHVLKWSSKEMTVC